MARLICIDPGHGGGDPGAVSDSRYEKNDVLRLSKAVATALNKQGIETLLTRESDIPISIAARCSKANAAGCDYFLSLHRDAAGANAYGISAWVYTKAPAAVVQQAQYILDEVLAVTPTYNRKVNKGTPQSYDDFGVNSGTHMPSCLLELGFITNAEDNKRFDTYFDQYAEAITRGLCKAVGVAYKPPTQDTEGYRVQVGYFKNKANAEAYMQEVVKAGFPAFVTKAN